MQLANELQGLQLLNDNPQRVFALTFNPRNNKWVVLYTQHTRDLEPGNFQFVRAFAAADTPAMAVADALKFIVRGVGTHADAKVGAF